jgi:hypothetical protein
VIEVERKVYGTVTRYFIKGTQTLHREDGPAVIWADKTEEWYYNGRRHRLDGPAIEANDGIKVWYFNGNCHREDGPAVEYDNGVMFWYLNGNHFSTKESWFEALTEGQKTKVFYSEYFIRG